MAARIAGSRSALAVNRGENLLGALDLTPCDEELRQSTRGSRIAGVFGQDGGIKLRRAFGITRRRQGLGFGQPAGVVQDWTDEPLDEALDFPFRQGAHEAIDRLASLKGDHGGNGTHAQTARNLRMLVDIHLDELDLAARRVDRLFEDRRELFAGFAPRAPRNRPGPAGATIRQSHRR